MVSLLLRLQKYGQIGIYTLGLALFTVQGDLLRHGLFSSKSLKLLLRLTLAFQDLLVLVVFHLTVWRLRRHHLAPVA